MPTPREHCDFFEASEYELLSRPPANGFDLMTMVSSGLEDEWFPVNGKNGWSEAWFKKEEMLKLCVYRNGHDTCDNDRQIATYQLKDELWIPSEIFEFAICARP